MAIAGQKDSLMQDKMARELVKQRQQEMSSQRQQESPINQDEPSYKEMTITDLTISNFNFIDNVMPKSPVKIIE